MNVGTFKLNSGAFLAFLVGFSSSPSLFSYWIPNWVVLIFLLIYFINSFRVHEFKFLNIRLFYLNSLYACIYLFLVVYLLFFKPNQPILPAILNCFLISLFALSFIIKRKDEEFVRSIIILWRYIFWIVPVFTVLSYILNLTYPEFNVSLHIESNLEGNYRSYILNPFGVLIKQGYNDYFINRQVGILAEPGMSSFVFLVNFLLGISGKSQYFTKNFAFVNLAASFTTHSFAFYVVFSLTVLYYIVSLSKRYLLAMVIIASLFIIKYYEDLMYVISLNFANSSGESRLGDLSFLNLLAQKKPLGIFYGFIWHPELRQLHASGQLPSAFAQLYYQFGVFFLVLYFMLIRDFVGKFKYVFIVFILYGFSLDFQTFWFLPILGIVVRQSYFTIINENYSIS